MAPQTAYHSIYPDIHVPTDLSLHQFLVAYNPDDVLPDNVILEDLDPNGSKMTYSGLRRDSAIGARALVNAFNLRAGDTVVIFAQNSVNYALLAHSVMWFGGIIVWVILLSSPEFIIPWTPAYFYAFGGKWNKLDGIRLRAHTLPRDCKCQTCLGRPGFERSYRRSLVKNGTRIQNTAHRIRKFIIWICKCRS